MAWYWWVLIAVAAVGIGYFKLKVWKMLIEKRKLAPAPEEEEQP